MVNCIVLDDEHRARNVLSDYIVNTDGLQLLGSFESPDAVSASVDSQQIDLVFSDIVMGETNGIAYFKSFVAPPFFVFVSAHPQYAVESFELGVLDFIPKPISYTRFLKSVGKARVAMQNVKCQDVDKDFLVIRKGERHHVVRHEHIRYIAGDGDYVTVVDADGAHLMASTLRAMENILPKERFRRVQKSYIINTDYMLSATASEVWVKGEGDKKQAIPVGKAYRRALFDWLYSK